MFRKSFPVIARQLNLSFSKTEVRKLSFLTFQQKTYRQKIIPVQFTGCNITVRSYAKSKDVRKDKKRRVQIDENELAEVMDVEKFYSELNKPIEVFKEDLINSVTLRSSQGAIESFKIEFEGDTYTIQDLAEIGKKGGNTYILDFCNFPQAISTAVKALQSSEMNLNVQQDGTKVFIPIPKVTKEHREILAKKAKALFIKCRDSIKKCQLKYIANLKKIDRLSEELRLRVTDQINTLGDRQVQAAETIFKEKEKELLKTE